jgi:hypothetical protein
VVIIWPCSLEIRQRTDPSAQEEHTNLAPAERSLRERPAVLPGRKRADSGKDPGGIWTSVWSQAPFLVGRVLLEIGGDEDSQVPRMAVSLVIPY